MYLGRKIGSFTAEDSGIVAPGAQPKAVAAEIQKSIQAVEAPVELVVANTAPELETGLGSTERDRLWSLIGVLRKANARLFKANRRLTKEAEALRSELSAQDQLTVASILEAAPEGASIRS